MKRALSVALFFLLLFAASALASSLSLGIIGGADGPTAVFVTGEGGFFRLLAALMRFLLGFFCK